MKSISGVVRILFAYFQFELLSRGQVQPSSSFKESLIPMYYQIYQRSGFANILQVDWLDYHICSAHKHTHFVDCL